ncbi:MAG: oligoendopeptidase F [bacterium]|nr:oligoendopeptidase F [bacterium]
MGEVRTIPAREEINVRDTWALEDLYETDEAWEAQIKEMEESMGKLSAYAGKLGGSAEELLAFLRLQDDMECVLDRLYVYANEKLHQDMSVSKYQGYTTRVQSLVVQFGGACSFAEPEILAIPEETLKGFFESCPKLEHYRLLIDRILYAKEHTLSPKEEAILAQTHELSSAPEDVYSLLTDVDLSFGTIKDENGNETELTDINYVSMLQSTDRRVRKDAFEALYRVYGQYKNSIAALFQANVKKARFYANVRNYASSIEMSLDGSRIPVSVYESLIEAVHSALPDMYRYVALRKRVLGVDELHMYDVYVPIVKDYDMNVTFEEAKELVLKGLAPMGEEYLSHLREGFSNRWIDVYENKNKRGGAYSWGAYGVHPYVLLNYQGKLDDVFTLAHEMGHALHTYYSNAAQPHVYSGYRLFVAEVASICNESLLIRYLLAQSKDKQEKCYLLNHFLDQFKGTLFRQTMFAEFEMIMHRMYAQGEALTAERICEIYLELNKKYFGDDMVSDPQIALEWARIPHFYTEFYVYQYATGFAAAIALSDKILREGEPAVEAYKSFLKGGCSKDPLDLLRMAGIDMSRPEPVKDALKLFGESVSELEGLLG